MHIRDDAARPTLEVGRLADTVAALREGTGLIVQLSTGGAVTDSFASRLAVLDAAPDACSLTCGTVNFGDDVFSNPWPFIKDLYQLTRERQVVPEFELFDLGHIATLHRLLAEFGPPAGGHVHCDLVMGVPGGMPGDVATLAAAVAALPAGATWSATGIGRTTLPVMLGALRRRRPPPGRHGRHPDLLPRPPRRPQRRTGRARRRPGPPSPAPPMLRPLRRPRLTACYYRSLCTAQAGSTPSYAPQLGAPPSRARPPSPASLTSASAPRPARLATAGSLSGSGAGGRKSDLASLWHPPYQIIRCGCPTHAAGTTWLGHPHRRARRPACNMRRGTLAGAQQHQQPGPGHVPARRKTSSR